MKWTHVGCLMAMVAVTVVVVPTVFTADDATNASPIYGVTVPDGYRKWELIAPAVEADPLNEIRAVLGNRATMQDYEKGTL